MKTYNWVTLGYGVIAHQLADAMQQEGRTLYGVANRTYSKAKDFAEKYHIPKYMKIFRTFLLTKM